MANNDYIKPTGKYEDWNVYKLSLIVTDITDLFVRTYLDKYHDRTVDQMVQAARSCKQNIVEGSVAAATSRETEIKLTNVAKASLAELREDYRDFLRHNDCAQWVKDDPRVIVTREFAKCHDDPRDYIDRLKNRSLETFCNIAITLCHQLDYLLYCVIERAKKNFLENGGIKEEMYRARTSVRGRDQRHQSYQSHQSPQPPQSPQSPQSHQSPQPPQIYQSPQSHQSAQPPQSYQSPQSHQSPQPPQSYQSPQSHQSAQLPQNNQGYQNYRPGDGSDNSDSSDKK